MAELVIFYLLSETYVSWALVPVFINRSYIEMRNGIQLIVSSLDHHHAYIIFATWILLLFAMSLIQIDVRTFKHLFFILIKVFIHLIRILVTFKMRKFVMLRVFPILLILIPNYWFLFLLSSYNLIFSNIIIFDLFYFLFVFLVTFFWPIHRPTCLECFLFFPVVIVCLLSTFLYYHVFSIILMILICNWFSTNLYIDIFLWVKVMIGTAYLNIRHVFIILGFNIK